MLGRALLAAGLMALGIGALAQAQIFGPAAYVAASGAATYTGPGDLTTYSWWASTSRAFSAATRGTKAVQLCQPAGSNCVDVNSDATTGIVPNAPTVNAAACDNSGHICTLQCMYEKVGGADLCRASQPTQQPLWKVSAIGSLPCGQYVRANPSLLAFTTGPTATQPFLASAVANRNTGQTANQNYIFETNTDTVVLLNTTGASNVNLYAGTALAVTLTDGNWGSIAAIYNGASSYLNVNGTTNTGAGGAANATATVIVGTNSGGINAYDGYICEVGLASGVSSTATADAVEANTKTFYGF